MGFEVNSNNDGHNNEINENLLIETKDLEDAHAVIVGISDYPGDKSDLRLPASKAKEFRNTLIEHGWNSENIKYLSNGDAKKDNIVAELDWLSQFPGTVLFYYYGHGTQIKDQDDDEPGIDRKDEALCCYDSITNTNSGLDSDKLLLDDEMKQIVNGFNADEIVLIFISCFSGGMIENGKALIKDKISTLPLFNRPKIAKLLNTIVKMPLFNKIVRLQSDEIEEELIDKQPMEELKSSNTVIITACQEYLKTYEFLFEAEPTAEWLRRSLEGGIFEQANADKNNDRNITAEEAFDFTQPIAVLKMVTSLRYGPTAMKAINEWIKGNIPTGMMLIALSLLGLTLPVPQIYDGNPNQDIVLTNI
jgi:hypothetical protein